MIFAGINDKVTDLSGTYEVRLEDGSRYSAVLPGSLDENQIGYPDEDTEKWHPDAEYETGSEQNMDLHVKGVIMGRFARRFTYEGPATFRRTFVYPLTDRRVFLFVERARQLRAILNGQALEPYQSGTLSTPYVYEVTDELAETNELMFISDNCYPGWPKQAIRYSSAATDESQTNWNGILGRICLIEKDPDFISSVRVYPEKSHLCVQVEIDAHKARKAELTLESPVMVSFQKEVDLKAGKNLVAFSEIPIITDRNEKNWDLEEGNLLPFCVSGDGLAKVTVHFGLRFFADRSSPFLMLNDRRIFWRCETNTGIFPDAGHPPMDLNTWLEIFRTYQAYGLNAVRFHSWCPPDAAFAAADQVGMLVQVELSDWDPKTALESEEAFTYYKEELLAVLKEYANHPSLVMLTLGNELHADETGVYHMNLLVSLAREADPTRLYAISSNPFYGDKGTDEASDFFTASGYYGTMLRATSQGMKGYLNENLRGTSGNHDQVLSEIRKRWKKPVFAFEAGQYEILPDFRELESFTGALVPESLCQIRKNAQNRGFLKKWDARVEASGELARIAYKEEIEGVLRTAEFSGISILGLQDFHGQGGAFVGMLNSHLKRKPYSFSDPGKWSFFRDVVPMAVFDRYTWFSNEQFSFFVEVANYGKRDLSENLEIGFFREDGTSVFQESLSVSAPMGVLTKTEKFAVELNDCEKEGKYILSLQYGEYQNTYPVWVYPEEVCFDGTDTGNVVITGSASEAEKAVAAGRDVLYSPVATEKSFPKSIRTCFTTDFWSVGTFTGQAGYMGILADPESPALRNFPTQSHSDFQWYHLTKDARAMILPDEKGTVLEALDCYARLRHLALLYEARVENGRILVSGLGLLEKLAFPETHAMLKSLLAYMESDAFQPEVRKSFSEIEKL